MHHLFMTWNKIVIPEIDQLVHVLIIVPFFTLEI